MPDATEEKKERSADNNIMSSFFSGTIGRYNVVLSSAQLLLIHPPLRIGSVSVGYVARALACDAAVHSAERPPSYGGLALVPTAFVFLPLFRVRKQKRLKENSRSGFPLAHPLTNSLSGSAQLL